MCELIFIFFGSMLLWLGIDSIIEGDNQTEPSVRNIGIMLVVVSSTMLLISIGSLIHKLKLYIERKSYSKIEPESEFQV